MGSVNFSYTYDDRYRLVSEVQNIMGQEFTTSYLYDSQDRVISEEGFTDVDYIYNKQGKVKSIPGFIDDSSYNAFGSILTRDYNNGLVQEFLYDVDTNRLSSIGIAAVQNLSYAYDAVGNIISIDDFAYSRYHNMTYDSLNRLDTVQINSETYSYTFNPIGNIMNIVHDNSSTKFVYNGAQAHAPSTVIEETAGVDVYSVSELETSSKDKVYEMFLINDAFSSTLANLSVDLGDGSSFNTSLSVADNVMVFVENNYSSGGDYSVNVSSGSDFESLDVKFGVRASSLDVLLANKSKTLIEFIMYNDVAEMTYNVAWNCSDGIISIYSANLSGNQSLYDYLAMNYTSPGDKEFACTVDSDDGSETISVDFEIKGLEIEDYDILVTDVSKRVISYNLKNYFSDVEANIFMQDDVDSYSQLANLSHDEDIMVFVESNSSSDGVKQVLTSVSYENYSSNYTETYLQRGVEVQNYYRTQKEGISNIISFDVLNNWYNESVNWTLSDPGISSSTYLDTNESLMVIVETDTIGDGRAEVTAMVSSFVDHVKNAFEIKPLKIASFLTLSEGTTSVSEMVVENNLGSSQVFDWNFYDEVSNTSGSAVVSSDVFVFIESEMNDSGVYRSSVSVNSSNYSDSSSGVIIS